MKSETTVKVAACIYLYLSVPAYQIPYQTCQTIPKCESHFQNPISGTPN